MEHCGQITKRSRTNTTFQQQNAKYVENIIIKENNCETMQRQLQK